MAEASQVPQKSHLSPVNCLCDASRMQQERWRCLVGREKLKLRFVKGRRGTLQAKMGVLEPHPANVAAAQASTRGCQNIPEICVGPMRSSDRSTFEPAKLLLCCAPCMRRSSAARESRSIFSTAQHPGATPLRADSRPRFRRCTPAAAQPPQRCAQNPSPRAAPTQQGPLPASATPLRLPRQFPC